MKILQTIYEFYNMDFDKVCGLYHVELDNGSKHYFLRNDKSVGAIKHCYGEPASKCVLIIRDDVKLEFFNILKKRINKNN
jgi:hypothetical protein